MIKKLISISSRSPSPTSPRTSHGSSPSHLVASLAKLKLPPNTGAGAVPVDRKFVSPLGVSPLAQSPTCLHKYSGTEMLVELTVKINSACRLDYTSRVVLGDWHEHAPDLAKRFALYFLASVAKRVTINVYDVRRKARNFYECKNQAVRRRSVDVLFFGRIQVIEEVSPEILDKSIRQIAKVWVDSNSDLRVFGSLLNVYLHNQPYTFPFLLFPFALVNEGAEAVNFFSSKLIFEFFNQQTMGSAFDLSEGDKRSDLDNVFNQYKEFIDIGTQSKLPHHLRPLIAAYVVGVESALNVYK